MFDKVTFKGKEIIESGHFKNELYNVYKKNLDLVFEILEDGAHTKESKEKMRVEKRTKGGRWELVYVETENEIVRVHLKFVR
ncbi:MAG: hypothetical protein V3R93_08035 [Candidatus Hydrothermarchaeaceae archaeon]